MENPSFSLMFRNEPLTELTVGKANVQLVANPETGVIMAIMSIYNTTNDTIRLHPSDFSLYTEGGSTVTATGQADIPALAPGKIINTTCQFPIVNSRLFYSFTQLPGDIRRKYNLNIDLAGTPKTITRSIDEKEHMEYLKTHGKEAKSIIYVPEPDVEEQQQYQKDAGMSDFVFADNTEISTAGVNMHFKAYQIGDSLSIAVRIVNHSIHQISINPDRFFHIDGITKSTENQPIPLRKSQRYIDTFRFHTTKAPDKFLLMKESVHVMIDGKKHPLFSSDINFAPAPRTTP